MGNNNEKCSEMKNAKLDELEEIENLKKYTAYGNTQEEALSNLIYMCKEHKIPEPKHIGNSYISGTIIIPYMTQSELRLNPVWFLNRNGRHVAFLYHEPMF